MLNGQVQGVGLVETGMDGFSDTCSRRAFPTGIYNTLPHDHPDCFPQIHTKRQRLGGGRHRRE